MPAGWAAAADLSADSEAAGCAPSRAQPVRPLPPLPCRPPDSRPALLTTPQLARFPPFHHGLNSLLTLACRPLVDRRGPPPPPPPPPPSGTPHRPRAYGPPSVAEYAASPHPPPHPPLLPSVPSPSSLPLFGAATLPPSPPASSATPPPLFPPRLSPPPDPPHSTRYSVAALRVIGAAAGGRASGGACTGWRGPRYSPGGARPRRPPSGVAAIARFAWGGAVAAVAASLALLAVELAQAAAPLGVACRQVAPPLSNPPLPNPLYPTLT